MHAVVPADRGVRRAQSDGALGAVAKLRRARSDPDRVRTPPSRIPCRRASTCCAHATVAAPSVRITWSIGMARCTSWSTTSAAPGMPVPAAGARSPTSTPRRSGSSWTTTAVMRTASADRRAAAPARRSLRAARHPAWAGHRPRRRRRPASAIRATGSHGRAWPPKASVAGRTRTQAIRQRISIR